MSQHDRYISPFSTRYSSDEMQYIFSDDNKFRTWRRLWVLRIWKDHRTSDRESVKESL